MAKSPSGRFRGLIILSIVISNFLLSQGITGENQIPVRVLLIKPLLHFLHTRTNKFMNNSTKNWSGSRLLKAEEFTSRGWNEKRSTEHT